MIISELAEATQPSPVLTSIKNTAIDFFCGAGGLTYGLREAGINVTTGFDIDTDCEYAYEQNNPGSKFIEQNISELKAQQVSDLYPPDNYKILVGCAPCQSFSKYTRKNKSAKDQKWELVRSFADLIQEIKPDVVSMENVPELASHQVYNEFLLKLHESQYSISASIVFCPDYGIPQQRERLVLFASRLGPISIIPPEYHSENYPTVRSAIGNLEALRAGDESPKDRFHKSSKLAPINLRRIRASKAGGSWRDWPIDLRADCHRSKSGATYPSVYGRMEWDKPSPTITTQYFGFGNGRFGHPDQDRAISLREGAILQSFPHDYIFTAPNQNVSFATIGKMIGNAVPPKLGEVVGKTIMNHLKQFTSSQTTVTIPENANSTNF
ncbi:DNA cytosine methyltransferase [Spirosoma foliorum]|uniref:Cytosine-specific methyltransferase n=1 Tax=Spirosoma foliorum TaxID=2710596 RepID=A0A7G5GRM7_9BACT|nr:DNA cytosine methyltransferase [Spirosoma foliorum]QMW01519.1 DNA cytosine methyltransferase [Spirosoma foliorum]